MPLEFVAAEVARPAAGADAADGRVLRPAGRAAHGDRARQGGRARCSRSVGRRRQPRQGRPGDRRDRPRRPAEPRRRSRRAGRIGAGQPDRGRAPAHRQRRPGGAELHLADGAADLAGAPRRGARAAQVGAGAARLVARRHPRGDARGADLGHRRQAPRRAGREGQRRAADRHRRRPRRRSSSPARSARTRSRCSRRARRRRFASKGRAATCRAGSTASRRPPRPARARSASSSSSTTRTSAFAPASTRRRASSSPTDAERLTVPAGAVGQASGQDFVWTIEKGALVRRIVVTGRRDAGQAAGSRSSRACSPMRRSSPCASTT